MGNLCGKASKDDDNFAGEGRTLGSAPPSKASTRAAVPATAGGATRSTPATVGRTIGGDNASSSDPRNAALAAAEARAQKAQGTGKLNQQLAAQKKMSRQDTLAHASEETRAQRDADAATEARNYN